MHILNSSALALEIYSSKFVKGSFFDRMDEMPLPEKNIM